MNRFLAGQQGKQPAAARKDEVDQDAMRSTLFDVEKKKPAAHASGAGSAVRNRIQVHAGSDGSDQQQWRPKEFD